MINTPVTIYVDVGIDGIIYDALQVKNQITNVEDSGNLYIPKEYKLEQNYPNPFNPSTTIEFALPTPGFVTLSIFNILGEKVATLISEELTSGSYKYHWDARRLTSGVYLYKLEAGNNILVRKMILIR